MRNAHQWILGVLVVAAGYAASCSSDGTAPVPSGALVGSGGSVGGTGNVTTGVAGSSGSAGSGGTTSAGGSTSAGGTTSAGGSTNAAGATGTSGSTSAAGRTGTSGSTSAGGGMGKGGSTGTGGTRGSAGAGGNTGAGGTAGTSGTSASFWPAAYQATQGDSGMNPGKNCLSSCHNHGFAFAGTVYDSNGNGLDSVEVGVKLTNGQFYSVYSGILTGNFFYQGSGLNLAGADIRVRDANGEKQMPVTSSSSGACNSCHDGSANPRITAP